MKKNYIYSKYDEHKIYRILTSTILCIFRIASFYHSTKPLIYEKIISLNKLELFQEKLHASRLLLVKSVRQCFTHLTNQITKKMYFIIIIGI